MIIDKNSRILVTGGSGFIGSNFIQYLLNQGFNNILNLDKASPRIQAHLPFWTNLDIRDKDQLNEHLLSFKPQIVIHLAARTDLLGNQLSDYDTNTEGFENLLEAVENFNALDFLMVTSSMYVCQPGYQPTNFEDYKPHTIYGESKVLTERIIKDRKEHTYKWCIIRPTSIWGPWFGEPYDQFFKMVLARRYFHIGGGTCQKTFGYVGNTVSQIASLINSDWVNINRQTFYLGDWPAYDISEWAEEIAHSDGIRLGTLPMWMIKLLASMGDSLKHLGVAFPMTSFRLKNMLTDNIHDLSPIESVHGPLVFTRKEGVVDTISWVRSQKTSN